MQFCFKCNRSAEYSIDEFPVCKIDACQNEARQLIGDTSSGQRAATTLKIRLYTIHSDQLLSPRPANHLSLKWNNKLAIQRVDELYDRGIDASNVNHDPNGTAIYNLVPGKLGSVWEMIRIEDSARYHDKPKPHFDFFYATARMKIPVSKRSLPLHKISTSITVDYTQSQVTAGCHFLGAAVAALSIVKELFNDEITFHDAKEAYGRRVMLLAEEMDQDSTPITDAYEAYILS